MTKRIDGIGQFAPQDERDAAQWADLAHLVARYPGAFTRDIAGGGHVTGSAFVLSPDNRSVLLTHHRKLNRWLQLGGHCDGIRDARFVAQKEAYEESGLDQITLLQSSVFDVDIHAIPANATDPEHKHFDVRFLFRAGSEAFTVSQESHALAWVPLAEVAQMTQAPSLQRMARRATKWLGSLRNSAG